MSHSITIGLRFQSERLGSLRSALLKVSLVFVLVFMLMEAVSSVSWITRLQSERIRGVSQAGPIEDYLAYYAAGRLVIEGDGRSLYERESIRAIQHEAMGRSVGGSGVLPYFNPPFVAAAMAPLATADVATFSTVLLVIVLAMVMAGGYACSALMGITGGKSRLLFWTAYLSFHATTWLIAEIQLSMFLVLGWAGFVAFQSRGQYQMSGLALSLVLVKPQMAVLAFAYLLWQRQWKALVPFVMVGMMGALISVVVAGPAIVVEYPKFLMQSTGWEGSGVNADQMFGWNSVAAAITGDRSPPLAVVALFVVPTLFLVARAITLHSEPTEPAFLLQGSILIFATLLINPHLYRQDLVLLVVALGLLVAYSQRVGIGREIPAAIAITFWFVVFWGPRLVIDHGLPIVPVAMALTMVGSYLLIRGRTIRADGSATVTSAEPGVITRNALA